jgi:1,2-phenylacetyl-CoA epoxidase PaaB subunit
MLDSLSWDAEAQQEALIHAQEIANRDPEAASMLITQLLHIQQTQPDEPAPSLYDPLALYEVMATEKGWTPKEMDEMHYMTFFGIVRKRNERVREENRRAMTDYGK